MIGLFRRALQFSLVRDYGIGFVLLGVCVYLTFATREPSSELDLTEHGLKRLGSAVEAEARKSGRGHSRQKAPMLLLNDSTTRINADRFGRSVTTQQVRSAATPRDVRVALKTYLDQTSSSEVLAIIALDRDLAKHASRIKEDLGLAHAPVLMPPQRTRSNFLQYENLVLNVASNVSIVGIMAVGMTFVILTAGIDLSVGSIIALVSVLAGLAMMSTTGENQWAFRFDSPIMGAAVGVLAAILVGAAAGGAQGTIITRFNVPPFIMTLATMQIARGLALHITQAGTIPNLPGPFRWIGTGFLLPDLIGNRLPVPVFLMIVIYVLAWLVLKHTVFGRYVYAVGGNEEAARLSGVPVRLVKFAVYMISGITAAIGGIILTARLGTGSARYGEGYELYVIAAAVVGGTSLFGGEGRILGTLLGALFIAVINNGLNLTGVSSYIQIIVIGAVILLAVLFDQLKKRLS